MSTRANDVRLRLVIHPTWATQICAVPVPIRRVSPTVESVVADFRRIAVNSERDLAECRELIVQCPCGLLQSRDGQWVKGTPVHGNITHSVCPACKAKAMKRLAQIRSKQAA